MFFDTDVNRGVHLISQFGDVDTRIEQADGLGMDRLGHGDRHALTGFDSLVLSLLPRLVGRLSVSEGLKGLGDCVILLPHVLIANCGDRRRSWVLRGSLEQFRSACVSDTVHGCQSRPVFGLDDEQRVRMKSSKLVYHLLCGQGQVSFHGVWQV